VVVWVLVGLVDRRGWLLMQERDDKTTVDPNRWSLIGGAVEPGESSLAAARRELEEETGIVTDALRSLGPRTLPCDVHGEDNYELFTARTSVAEADVCCNGVDR
jgi:8-oxo-dGTP diphosphatase